jgi:protein-tyrosine phosphatase
MSDHDLRDIARLSYLPPVIFDLIRMADRSGGVDSASVTRVVGKDADLETKKLQLRFNQQSKSAVFQKFTSALAMQETTTAKNGEETILGQRVWGGVKVPLMLVAAEDDKLTPVEEAVRIKEWLLPVRHDSVATAPASENTVPSNPDSDISLPPRHTSDPDMQYEKSSTIHASKLKLIIFPSPAAHGLLYSSTDVRILSRRIETFLAEHADERLAPGWQLRHMTTGGKWDVKNLKKWQAVAPCSEPIGGLFRAMKTMREIDEVHSPREFVKRYSWKVIPDGVAMVVDISFDVPVYDKKGLEDGGVEYHKLPTVSKQPPGADEIEQFIALIDSLRESPKLRSANEDAPHPTIGVHCHYGFNRTGHLICCYLVERLQWKLQDAVAEFARKKPPGIKHDYFVNELYVRYAADKSRAYSNV